MHIGVITDAPGAWAERMAAHDSMLFPVPDSISDEAAVLADPFAVSFHAIVRHPPPAGGKGRGVGGRRPGAHQRWPSCGPSTPTWRWRWSPASPPRWPWPSGSAPPWSSPTSPASRCSRPWPTWSGGVLHTPILGLPVTRPGHIDVVYDTVGKPETFEVAVRVLAERGTLVYTGVSTPERWEWSPVYFKELTVTGSNAFGVEELDGVRKHAIAHYLDLVADGRIDISAMLTHRFTLDDWRGALRSLAVPGESGAIKVAFDPNAG